jgi:hypothetical protein
MIIVVLFTSYLLTSIQLTCWQFIRFAFFRTNNQVNQSFSQSIKFAWSWLIYGSNQDSYLFKLRWLVFLLWIPTILWVFYGVGRQNLLFSFEYGLHTYSSQEQLPGGCTAVALVIPTVNMINLTKEMTSFSWKHKDCLMDDLAFQSNGETPLLHLVPHLFQHMGAFSSFNVNGTMPNWQTFKTSNLFDISDDLQ